MNKTFPFTAILGQDKLKLALLLNVVEPNIGGLLVLGSRGTGKSTTIRAIKELLPPIATIDDDLFNASPECLPTMGDKYIKKQSAKCPMPMVELPLGVTEEHICGTLDLDAVLSRGIAELKPGLLARANRGILYVDEINLLDDGLTDTLLDAAASGWNVVERDGISMQHPARFILIGSGNTEERTLRPQFVDRFGLCVKPLTYENVTLRAEILDNCMRFDKDPGLFRDAYAFLQENLREKLLRAIHLLPNVSISQSLQNIICQVCGNLKILGIRGDLTIVRASRAHAAFEGRAYVVLKDVGAVIGMSLCHRLAHDTCDIGSSSRMVEDIFWKVASSLC